MTQGSVSNTSYTQGGTTVYNYEVDSYLQIIEHSNSKYQLGESNFDNCGQWSSFTVGSNHCHGVVGGLSAENGINLRNQFLGVQVAMSCPMITGLPLSLTDHTFDKTAILGVFLIIPIFLIKETKRQFILIAHPTIS